MYLKFNISIIIISVLLAQNSVLSATNEKTQSHHATWGARSQRDVHLKREILTEKFQPMRIISTDYSYRPKRGDLNYDRTITQIVVTDQYTNDNGGYATLKDGGPSTNYAIIHLKSQRNHGYNFIIDIYGQ